MKTCRILLTLALALGAAASRPDSARAGYTITDVGPFNSNGPYLFEVPQAINDTGQVAGFRVPHINGDNLAFLYSNGAATYPIQNFFGSTINAINNAGQYAGGLNLSFPFSVPQAFVNLNGTVTALNGYDASLGINASGQVVGGALVSFGNGVYSGSVGHAFLYSNGMTTDIGTLGGNSATAIAINNSGTITGASNLVAGGPLHAFLSLNGKMTDLGTLGGSTSLGLTVTASGQVYGLSTVAGDSTFHEFLYANGRMTDLGSLGPGYLPPPSNFFAIPFDRPFPSINDLGQLVGSIGNGFGGTAVLYSGGMMTDLNTLIDPNSGWKLTGATVINDLGQIAGMGIDPQGDSHAFLLTPTSSVPEPSSLILLGSGLAAWAFTGRRCFSGRAK